MKIQCDVCGGEAASVFCCADEAALCEACDRRIHRANKLAGKHRRLSLINPSSTNGHTLPLCDVCQERRGFIFCREDRAILCRECDEPIHAATGLTLKHSRFLLAGIRLSSHDPPAAAAAAAAAADHHEALPAAAAATKNKNLDVHTTTPSSSLDACSGSSSISDYLMKTLPGWRVEDLLLDDQVVEDISPSVDVAAAAATQQHMLAAPHVPQMPPYTAAAQYHRRHHGMAAPAKNSMYPPPPPVKTMASGAGERGGSWSDEALAVPQISTTTTTNKRARTSASTTTPWLWSF